MASVNKVILLGNLGQDPEIRYLASGDAVANVSLATSEKFKDKTGVTKETTEWSRLVFYGRLAEIVDAYVAKGSQIYVEGKLKTDKYTGKDGIERYVTKVVCNHLVMLDSPSGSQNNAQQGKNEYKNASAGSSKTHPEATANLNGLDDDIPF